MSGSETAAWIFLTVLTAGMLAWVGARVVMVQHEDRKRRTLLRDISRDYRDNQRR